MLGTRQMLIIWGDVRRYIYTKILWLVAAAILTGLETFNTYKLARKGQIYLKILNLIGTLNLTGLI